MLPFTKQTLVEKKTLDGGPYILFINFSQFLYQISACKNRINFYFLDRDITKLFTNGFYRLYEYIVSHLPSTSGI